MTYTVLCDYADGWSQARVGFDGETVHRFAVNGLDFAVVRLTDDFDFPVTKYQVAYGDLCVCPLGDELPLDAMDEVDVEEFITKALSFGDALAKRIKKFTVTVAAAPERFPALD